jgi:hypothetical protein
VTIVEGVDEGTGGEFEEEHLSFLGGG